MVLRLCDEYGMNLEVHTTEKCRAESADVRFVHIFPILDHVSRLLKTNLVQTPAIYKTYPE